jgi:hypothetical protein
VREIAAERLIFDRSDQQNSNQPQSYTPKQLSSAPRRHMGGAGGWWLILPIAPFAGCSTYYVLRTSAVYSALRPSFISVNQIRWPPNFVYVLCLVRPHVMPTKTSVGPNEVVRLEVLRLIPPLPLSLGSCAKSRSCESRSPANFALCYGDALLCALCSVLVKGSTGVPCSLVL